MALLKCVAYIQKAPSGLILINSHNIAENSSRARRAMGICLQFDALYPNVTCFKVLELSWRLRGMTSATAFNAAESVLENLNMLKKMHSKAADLFGGQKRKLSVAIA
jgi:ATP-binding cassette, subfamily A (ABC1), member 3